MADGIISTCLFVASIVFTLRPWSKYLWILNILSFIEGIAWTCLNSIGNSMIMVLWGDQGNAPMHLLHFGYPVGAIIGPLIAAAYVSDEVEETVTNGTTAISPFLYDITEGITEEPRFADDSEIEIAYAIGGAIVAANGVVFVILQCYTTCSGQGAISRNIAKKETPSYSWKEVLSPTKWGAGDKKFGLTIVLLVMAFYFILVATFKSSTTYYVPYAADSDLGFSNSEAAIYNSVLGFAGATGRACSIVAAKFVAIQVMLFIEVYGMVAAMVLMAFWGHDDVTGFWICSVLVLFFRDPIWPSAMTWTDKYVVLFAIVVGLSDMSSKTSDAIFAWVLGYTYTYVAMESIFYISVIFGILLCILLIIMHVVATRHGGRYEKEKFAVPDLIIEKVDISVTDSSCKLVSNEQVNINTINDTTYL